MTPVPAGDPMTEFKFIYLTALAVAALAVISALLARGRAP